MAPSKTREAEATTFLLVDSHGLAYRAYYALQHTGLLHPSSGMPSYAIHGFFRILFTALGRYNPSHSALVWDAPGKSFRQELYPDYKATRKPMPEDLRLQIEEIKELSEKCGFASIEIPNVEADDAIGSLATMLGRQAESRQAEILLLSSDKDCYQLLNDHVTMLRSNRGASELQRIDPQWIRRELHIGVEQITDYMGLIGDSVDNIPGAKGIGPKSAVELLREYGSLENIYRSIEKIRPPGLQKKLLDSQETALLSRQLASIKTDLAELKSISADHLKSPDILSTRSLQLFRDQGYNQIYRELKRRQEQREQREQAAREGREGEALEEGQMLLAGAGAGTPPSALQRQRSERGEGQDSRHDYTLVDTREKLSAAFKELQSDWGEERLLSLDTETDSASALQARLVGISLCAKPGRACYIALPPDDSPYREEGLAHQEALPLIREFLEQRAEERGLKIVGQNLKYDYLVLSQYGFRLPSPYFDTMIASYLCNPNIRRHNLDDMALDLLGRENIQYEEVVGKGAKRKNLSEIAPANICDYACEDADVALQLYLKLKLLIQERKLERVNREIELALIPVLLEMERQGVAIDRGYFEGLSQEYRERLEQLEQSIHSHAGYSFNINSTRELQKVLFEDLMLPKGKKTKTGYSTDQKVLEDLRGRHPLVDELLEHRKYSKIRSTYTEALPRLVNPKSGRIHTSFNQTIAATGRLSSTDPNLQNIPIREEIGRAIRRGFVTSQGNLLLSMDYSQIELRIMAHYSQDPALMDAFLRKGIDIHRRTAASLFGVAEQEVNADMRSAAKTVNFSIIYGVTDFGLARSLGIERSAAAEYIERFFQRYPGVKDYMNSTIAFAEDKGYVETITGRRRQIAEIRSGNHFRREGARRAAINTPIQGTSADIIKIAMIEIHKALEEEKLRSRIILQLHDELLFEMPPQEEERLIELAARRMEEAVKLTVPLQVQWGIGANWDEAH